MKEKNQTQTIKRPPLLMHLSEAFRAFGEFKKTTEFYRAFKRYKKGDGHPVLVIPGFMGSNTSTRRLRKFIKRLGYISYDWGLGRNYADLEEVNVLMELVDKIYAKHHVKVTLIGWSLGGVYAREIAKNRSDKIRQVITLGSPFAGITEPNNATWLFNLLKGKQVEELDSEWLDGLENPAPVPTTALYTKEDGVVSWKICKEKKEDDWHQNVEVRGSHMGLANNATVWFLIADRLQYGPENWEHFKYDGSMKKHVDFPLGEDVVSV